MSACTSERPFFPTVAWTSSGNNSSGNSNNHTGITNSSKSNCENSDNRSGNICLLRFRITLVHMPYAAGSVGRRV